MNDNFTDYAMLINAINSISTVRDYDWYLLGITFGSIVVSLVAICLTFLIYKRQTKLMEQQTKISEQQTHLAQQQNDIALFDKRFDNMQVVKIFINNINNHVITFTCAKAYINCYTDIEKAHLHYAMIFNSIDSCKIMEGRVPLSISEIHQRSLYGTIKLRDCLEVLKFIYPLSTNELLMIEELEGNLTKLLDSLLRENFAEYYRIFETIANNKKYINFHAEIQSKLRIIKSEESKHFFCSNTNTGTGND